MEVTMSKHDICMRLLEELRTALGDGDKRKCVGITPRPVVKADFNDDLGCGTSVQQSVGEHGYYITSAAKQKRIVLSKLIEKYGIDTVKSVLCMCTYLRPTEVVDSTHSAYLTQYDWEAAITAEQRTVDILLEYVRKIWRAVYAVYCEYGKSTVRADQELHYITAEELCKLYPDLDPDCRVKQYMDDKEYNVLFVIGIGADLSDGKPHDSRATDYDDYSTVTIFEEQSVTGLNGDLFVRHAPLKSKALELMSCGIRVDRTALLEQMGETALESQSKYHKSIINGEYSLTVGGGLGQERVLMYILELDDIDHTYPTLD